MQMRKSKTEILDTLTTNIERERIRLGFTQAEMAKKLNISLSTYLNIVNKRTLKIDFWVIYKLCHLCDKFLFELCDEATSPRQIIVGKSSNLSRRQLNFIDAIIEFESELADKNVTSTMIEAIVPTGNTEDGMLWDSCHVEMVDIGSDYERFKGRFHSAVKITTNALRPTYNRGDVLLVTKKHARHGDIAIVVNKNTRIAYIRKYLDGSRIELQPINEYGSTILVDANETPEWVVFGCVLTKVRSV